jgi:hypothetical protein
MPVTVATLYLVLIRSLLKPPTAHISCSDCLTADYLRCPLDRGSSRHMRLLGCALHEHIHQS